MFYKELFGVNYVNHMKKARGKEQGFLKFRKGDIGS
jgi:hypothetical protein